MVTIEVLSGKGGIGKTTWVLLLAFWWKQEGANVAVYDNDSMTHSLKDWFEDLDEDVGITLVDHLPSASEGFDILIMDQSPSVNHERMDCNATLYILEPHRLAIKSHERAKRMIVGRNHTLLVNKGDYRKSNHRANAKILRNEYGAFQARNNSIYEKFTEAGIDFFAMNKDSYFYKAKNEIALVAQDLERYF